LIIRKAQPEDFEALLPMATALASSFVVDPDLFRDSFRKCVSDDSSRVLLAVFDSSPVGYLLEFDHVAFFANGRVAVVEEIYVVPEHRHEGIGKALMREFETWAVSRDSAQIVVCTRRAAEFYSALGYQETATCFRYVLRTQAEPGRGRVHK
jgi:GNAT superfamily N-acetyltransferase